MNDSGFIETGYRPPTELKDELTPESFQDPSSEDKIHFFRSENNKIPELMQAIRSTVLIGKDRNNPSGSGVVVNHDGKKYLITATHVIGELLVDEEAVLRYYYKDISGAVQEGVIRRNDALYESITAGRRGLDVADVAIFPFEGDNEGVKLSDAEVGHDAGRVGVAIGFPGEFQDSWKENLNPLLSVGSVFKDKPKERTQYMMRIMQEHGLRETKDLKIYYSGRTMKGNSGGQLVDARGNIIGVLSGPARSLGKEDGIEKFSDVRPILMQVISEHEKIL